MKLEQFLLLCNPPEVSKVSGIPARTIREWKLQIKTNGEIKATVRSVGKLVVGLERAGITFD